MVFAGLTFKRTLKLPKLANCKIQTVKLPLSLAACLLFFLAPLYAQVSVEGDNFTGPDSEHSYVTAAPGFTLPFNLEMAGGDLNWDLSDFEGVTEDEELYQGIGEMGFLYQLTFDDPGNPDAMATHAIESVDLEEIDVDVELPVELSDVYQFYRNDSSGYYEVGLAFSASGFPIITPYEDTDRIYKFPLTFDERDTSDVSFEVSIPFIGFYGQSGTRYSHVDAWGTLTTPYGEYDVLRVRAERLITDTLFFGEFDIAETVQRPLQVDYAWISPDHDGEILRISVIGGQVVNVQMQSDGELGLSTNEATGGESELSISPNPAASVITATFPSDIGNYFITDLAGKTVASGTVRGGTRIIDVSDFAAGVYLLGFTSDAGHLSVAKLVRSQLR